MRRVQALTAQQLADLAGPRARLSLLEDRQLVLRRELAALGLLDQLGVRHHPRLGGAPAGPESRLANGSLVFAAGGILSRLASSIRGHFQHPGVLRSRPQRSLIPRW
jgi:hypothetical protein